MYKPLYEDHWGAFIYTVRRKIKGAFFTAQTNGENTFKARKKQFQITQFICVDTKCFKKTYELCSFQPQNQDISLRKVKRNPVLGRYSNRQKSRIKVGGAYFDALRRIKCFSDI